MSANRRIKKLLGTAVWLLAVLLMTEFGARIVRPRSPIIPDEVFNHVWRRNYRFASGDCTNVTNAQGWLHSSDVTREKPPGTFRIFYLGDSFTAGTCETTVPRVVEAWLAPQFSTAGLKLEIVNTAIQSYSPLVYELLLRKKILAFSPDLIVINVDLTDLFDDHLYRQIAVYDQSGAVAALPWGTRFSRNYHRTRDGLVESSALYRLVAAVREYSHVADWIAFSWDLGMWDNEAAKPSPSFDMTQFAWCSLPWGEATAAEAKKFEATLRRIVELAKPQEIPVVFTLVPHLSAFRGDCSPEVFNFFKAAVERGGGIYLDSFGGIAEKIQGHDPAAYYFENDIHFNDAGLILWSQVQRDFLLDSSKGLLPISDD